MSTASCATNEGAEVPPRIAVKALIYSEDLPPIEITSQLDLQPTTAVAKGIKYGARTGTPVNIPRHMWCLSSEAHVPVREFSSQLEWLLGKLYPVREQLLALRGSGAIDCELRGVVWTSGTAVDVLVETRQTAMLVDSQLALQIEFADYADAE